MIAAIKACSAATKPKMTYRWVMVGSQTNTTATGTIFTSDSTTAATWTSRTSPFGATKINDVASNGFDLWVAVGDAGKLATSADGITWTLQTSSFGADNIQSVAYGRDGYWVATGANNKIATSTNGTTWTQRTTGGTTEVWESIAFGAGLWAMIATNGTIRTATDPTGTWTARTSTLTSGTDIYYAPSQSVWVAGDDFGTTGALASSPDGITWTARNSTISGFTRVAPSRFGSNTAGIAHSTNSSIQDFDIETSTDGQTYTNRTPAVTTGQAWGFATDDNNRILALTTLNAGTTPTQYSDDLVTWTAGGTAGTAGTCFGRGIDHSAGKPAIQ